MFKKITSDDFSKLYTESAFVKCFLIYALISYFTFVLGGLLSKYIMYIPYYFFFKGLISISLVCFLATKMYSDYIFCTLSFADKKSLELYIAMLHISINALNIILHLYIFYVV